MSGDRNTVTTRSRSAGKLAELAPDLVRAIRKDGSALLFTEDPERYVATVLAVTGVSLGYVAVKENEGDREVATSSGAGRSAQTYRLWIAHEGNAADPEFLPPSTDGSHGSDATRSLKA